MPDELPPTEAHRVTLTEMLADVLTVGRVLRVCAPDSKAVTVILPRLEKRLRELRALQ